MDVRKIGFFISELRKNKDYTQAELAQMLNISHQAVSKWERGESLPDIGLLPDLASALEVTVDELLSGGTIRSTQQPQQEAQSVPTSTAEQKPTAPSQKETTFQYDFQHQKEQPAAPQNQDEFTATGETEGTTHNNVAEEQQHDDARQQPSKPKLSPGQISSLAPFLPKETIDALVGQLDCEVDWNMVDALAPFISRPALEQLVDRANGEIDAHKIIGIAPFLGQEQIDKLVDHAEGGTIDWGVVNGLAPFVSREKIRELVERTLDQSIEPAQLAGLAPFMDQADLVKIAERVTETDWKPELLTMIAPFLPPELLNKLVMQFK